MTVDRNGHIWSGRWKRVLTALMVLLAVPPAWPADTSVAGHYTVQTGTYGATAIRFAEAHFERLARQLKEEDRAHLRIIKGSRYYIVRVGKFVSKDEALALLERVRPLVHDAFVLKESGAYSARTVRLYNTPQPAPPTFYTLQIGTYARYAEAREKFESLSKALTADRLSHLRIERIGGGYSVRVGRFVHYAEARRFRDAAGEVLAESVIMKEGTAAEEVIVEYGESSPRVIVREGGPPEHGRTGMALKEKAPAERSVMNGEVQALIDNVSSHYDRGEYGRAAELLREGLARHPDDPDLLAWYGATLLNLRFPDKAYEQYRKAVEIAPDVPDYHAGLGYSLLDIYMDRAKGSIAAFKKALEIDPDNVSALEGLGIVYVSIDRKDLARDIYYRLKELDPAAAERLQEIITYGLDWEE